MRGVRRWALAWVGVALCLALAGSAEAEDAKPLFVKVHADWCGTCVRLNPTWEALREEFEGKARFVVLDVTRRSSLMEARQKAQELGIEEFFAAFRARTGTIGILDGETGRPLGILQGETDVARYRAVLERADSDGTS